MAAPCDMDHTDSVLREWTGNHRHFPFNETRTELNALMTLGSVFVTACNISLSV